MAIKGKVIKAKVGDRMVYRKTKHGPAPGPRATAVAPNRHGEGYSYIVDKFWIVAERLDDGRLRLRTRRGKEHVVRADDPNLRPARWWERWLYRKRFQDAERAPHETRNNGTEHDGIPAR